MASPSTILQDSDTPSLQQNALDGAPHCFMLPRFRLAESRRGERVLRKVRLDW